MASYKSQVVIDRPVTRSVTRQTWFDTGAPGETNHALDPHQQTLLDVNGKLEPTEMESESEEEGSGDDEEEEHPSHEGGGLQVGADWGQEPLKPEPAIPPKELKKALTQVRAGGCCASFILLGIFAVLFGIALSLESDRSLIYSWKDKVQDILFATHDMMMNTVQARMVPMMNDLIDFYETKGSQTLITTVDSINNITVTLVDTTSSIHETLKSLETRLKHIEDALAAVP